MTSPIKGNIRKPYIPKNTGQVGLVRSDGTPIPLVGLSYEGKLRGLAMELIIRQRYRNTEINPLETVYTFPVPDGAAVCGVTVSTADRVLKAEVEEREKAFDKYDDALAEGHGAMLLDQERANLLHLSVGSILPGKELVVEIRMVYEGAVEGKGVRLLLPTTVSPRYTPAATKAEDLAELERITPPYALEVPYGFTLIVEADLGCPITSVSSPSHALQVTIEKGSALVTTACREEPPDRDIVLTFETAEGFKTSALATYSEGRGHVLVTLMPDVPPKRDPQARDLAFVVDCSGSMQGTSIDEARRAIELCLRAMSAGDRFHILRFGSTTSALFEGFETLSQETLDETVQKVRSVEADLGGTEILGALTELLEASKLGKRIDVILITDGQVSNEAEVLALAQKNASKWRFFTFGIGTGVNETIVRKLASVTGGKSEFIAPRERIEPKVLRQFARIGAPLVEELSIDWGFKNAEATPIELPPIFPGDPFIAVAALGENVPEGHTVTIRGKTADGVREWKIAVHRVIGNSVPILWAKKRIVDLESDFGTPQSGSRQKRGRNRKDESLIAISKQYGILSSQTSFIAVEERTEKDKDSRPLELRRVPVMINDGWHGISSHDAVGAVMRSRQSGICYSMTTPAFARMSNQPLEDVEACAVYAQNKICADKVGQPYGVDGAVTEDPKVAGLVVPLYIKVMLCQRLDGSFTVDETLMVAAGISLDEFREWVRELRLPEDVVATALGAALLFQAEMKEARECSPYKLKALTWLDAQESVSSSTELLSKIFNRIRPADMQEKFKSKY